MLETLGILLAWVFKALELKQKIPSPMRWWRGRGRKRAYGLRVQKLRTQFNDAIGYNTYREELTQESFADLLGFQDLSILNEIEAGRRGPKPEDLDLMVAGTGACRRHLLEGVYSLWEGVVTNVQRPLDAMEIISEGVKAVTAVRVDKADGGVLLIVENTDWRDAKTVTMHSFHIGSSVGGTGRADQFEFFLLRCLLEPYLVPSEARALISEYTHYKPLGEGRVHIYGRVATDSEFEELASGSLHPIAYLSHHAMNDHWFMDCADVCRRSRLSQSFDDVHGSNFCDFQRNVRRKLQEESEC